MEPKLKHLEFIQNAIARMGSNSFFIKGWSVTLVSAIFALSAKDSDPKFSLIPIFIVPMFWGLDAFFLTTETRYRRLYSSVASLKGDTDFNMNPIAFIYAQTNSKTECKDATVYNSVISKTLIAFHGALFLVVSSVAIISNFDKLWNLSHKMIG